MAISRSIEIGNQYQKISLSVFRKGKQYLATASAAELISKKPLIKLIDEHLEMGLRAACHIKTKKLVFYTENDTIPVPKTEGSLPLNQRSVGGLVAKTLEEKVSSLSQYDAIVIKAVLFGKKIMTSRGEGLDPSAFAEMERLLTSEGFSISSRELREYMDLRIFNYEPFTIIRGYIIQNAPKGMRESLIIAAFRLKDLFRGLQKEMEMIYQARMEKMAGRKLSLSATDKKIIAANAKFLQCNLLTRRIDESDFGQQFNIDGSGMLSPAGWSALPSVDIDFHERRIIKCEFSHHPIPDKIKLIIIRSAEEYNRGIKG